MTPFIHSTVFTLLLIGLLSLLSCLGVAFAETADPPPTCREKLLLAAEKLGLGEVGFPDKQGPDIVKKTISPEAHAPIRDAAQEERSAESVAQWVGTMGAMFLLMRTLLRR